MENKIITVEIERREVGDFWFACVDLEVIRDTELTPCDKAVYAVICSFVDVHTRQWNLTVQKIADTAGCGARTCQKSIQRLVERGVMLRVERFQNGKQLACAYRIVGHRAACYKKTLAKTTETEGNNTPANIAGAVENCPPTPANFADCLLEPPVYETLSSPPTPPKGDEEGDGDLTLESGVPETPAERQRRFFQAVLTAYNTILPELPKATKLSKARESRLRTLLKEDPVRRELEWWRRFFQRVRQYPWPMGHNPSKWFASFDWLLGEEGMLKVIEGRFSKVAAPAPGGGRSITGAEQQKKHTKGGKVDVKAVLRANRTSEADRGNA